MSSMRVVRNVTLAAFVIVAGLAIQEAEARGDFCPSGCSCGFTGPSGEYEVSCWQVENCIEVYPDFCADFLSFCGNLCSPSVPDVYSCGSIGGACFATCGCAPLPN